MSQRSAPWWQSAVIYQIYPRSFADANGDGVGDLQGIIGHVEYLAWLGVDAVWLSPFYPSPMADFGYDVSDHSDVDPVFGTLGDLDALIAALHRNGIRLILDLVANHTSDRHPWFAESRASKGSPKRDWYIWRDPAPDGGPPTNWLSEFGGDAWTFDPATAQYYYHAYLSAQPDLNWRNPDVRAAMHGVMRFWLDRGVDGFRVDAAHHLIKDAEFRNNPLNPNFSPTMQPHHRVIRRYTTDRPELHRIIAEMRTLVEGYGDRILITEAYLPIDSLMHYYGEDLTGAHLPFNFHLIDTPWQAETVAALVERYESALPCGAWPNWVLGNHDKPRIASRIGRARARLAAMLLLTLRGTPTLYYGDELGMCSVPIPADRIQDPWERNVPGIGVGRDPSRTPMQWSAGPHSGFGDAEPWLPIAPDHTAFNVAVERDDPDSMLTLYRSLISLRRTTEALSTGSYAAGPQSDGIFAFHRCTGESRILVALNFSATSRILEDVGRGDILLTTVPGPRSRAVDRLLELAPLEGVVVRIAPD